MLISPDRPTHSYLETLSAFRIAGLVRKISRAGKSTTTESITAVVRKFPVLQKLVREHLEQYQWLNFYYQGPALDEETFLTRIADMLRKHRDISSLEQETKRHFEELRRKQALYREELRLSRDEAALFATAQTFLYLKAYRIETRDRANHAFDAIFHKLSRRSDGALDVHDFRYSTVHEIRDYVTSGSLPTTREERKQRREHSVFFFHEGSSGFLYGDEATEFLKKRIIAEEIDTTIQEIRGMVASAGHTRGIARIVNTVADNVKMNHADILISIATSPELLPAMRKAGAFVTDTGGITSHAAIVARELRKPCIIGTKIATKVLKDGDEVEVDANKGIVKILKHSS